ncbi:transcriptional regulator [Zafaria cholistanensis]|uniref:Manganese transport regulator n=1 Tax=Zafaria cholistanensis TaxID=1682741 RepID=A0A5A7NT35_9MICC|nr:metal-dependent transcriptional regulator [Zafaria cholistanensis]GER24040.1 transcriptional regulator [Zafaria cholistanensis]
MSPGVAGGTGGAELSASGQTYLKTVYGLGEWDTEAVTTGALAAKLGVSPASATAMVRKLVERGLLDHPPYGAVSLTSTGRARALGVVRRHRLLETFLVRELGYGWDQVHEEAARLEHTVSDLFVERLDRLLGHPAADPHGDPIPDAAGHLRLPAAVRLDRAPAGPAVVVRVSDANAETLRACSAAGLLPGATLDAGAHPLTAAQSAAVWVEPQETLR